VNALAPASTFTQRIIVGVGDLAVVSSPDVILSTYALGSCLGLVAYDATVRVGGLLHCMLPDSTIAPAKAARQAALFADTGIALLLRTLADLRAKPARLRLFLAGGACMVAGQDPFRIGERNIRAALDLLTAAGCAAPATDTGGFVNRNLHLEMHSGHVTTQSPRAVQQLSLAA